MLNATAEYAHKRIVQQMAVAQQHYHEAMCELHDHHQKMTAEESKLTRAIARLRNKLPPLFEDGGRLTREMAKTALLYLRAPPAALLDRRLQRARRLACIHGGTIR